MGAGVTSRTPLYIVCSPQHHVGRTLVARLLVDFFLMEDRPVKAFDFEADPPALIDFIPGHTTQADIGDIGGQMTLFDRLVMPDGVAKVVDLSPGAFRQFFTVMDRIDFIAGARGRGVVPIALFLAAPDGRSHRAYAELQEHLPDLLLVPVYNEGVVPGQRLRRDYPLARAISLPMQMPALVPLYRRYFDKPPFSFADFRATPPEAIPLEPYMELLRWMRRAFVEFRELELRLLLDNVRLSLQQDTAG